MVRVDIDFRIVDGVKDTLLGPHIFDLNYLTFQADENATVAGKELNPADLFIPDTVNLRTMSIEQTTFRGRSAYLFSKERIGETQKTKRPPNSRSILDIIHRTKNCISYILDG